MAQDKILAFRVNITGASQEAAGIAKIDASMQKLNKTRTQLLKKQRDGIGLTKNEQKGLASTTSRIEDLKNKKQQLVRVERQASREFKSTSGSMAELRARTAKLRAEMEQLNLKTTQGRLKQKQMGDEVKKNTKQIRDYDRSLSGSSTLVGEYSRGIVNAFKKIGAGIFVAVAAVRSFIRILSQATTQFAEFEKGQINVQTLLDRTNETLEGKTIQLMRNYGLQIADVNKALFDAVSAGVEGAKSVEFLETATQLAIGGVSDLTTAVDGITTVMNAYGKSTDEASQIAAAFFTAQKFGKTTVSELASEIGNVAPIASQLDISYQELLTTYAELTKQGINTQRASTAIQATLTALQKPSEQARKKFKELGIEVGATAIKQNGLFKTLVQVSEAAEKNADDLAEMIPNVRALTGVGALGTRQLKEYAEILEVVNTDFGDGSSLARAYALQAESLDQTISRIGASFTAAKIEIGRFFQPFLRGLANLVAPVETATNKLETQRDRVNQLAAELLNANTAEERRLDIITELNTISPDIIKNIDSENISMETLTGNLAEYNRQMVKRISLAGLTQEKQEILGQQGSKYSATIIEQNRALEFFNERMAIFSDQVGGELSDQAVQGFEKIRQAIEGTLDTPLDKTELQTYWDEIEQGLNDSGDQVFKLIPFWQEYTDAQLSELDITAQNYRNFVDENKDALKELDEAQNVILKGLGTGKTTTVTTTTETEDGGDLPAILQPIAIDESGLATVDALMKEAVDMLDTAFEEMRQVDEDNANLLENRLKIQLDRRTRWEQEAAEKQKQTDRDILESKLQTLDVIARTSDAVADLFFINAQKEIDAAEGNQAKQDQIRKKYYRREQVASSLTAGINTAVAITKAMAQTGVLSPFAIPGLIAQGLAAQIAIWAKKYETGGIVEPGNEVPGAPKSGDNTLALVKPGEVILNESQQRLLGGYDVFKNIGVPGFAAGGVVGTPTQSGGLMESQFLSLSQRIIDGMNDKKVYLQMNELKQAQGEYNTITETRGI